VSGGGKLPDKGAKTKMKKKTAKEIKTLSGFGSYRGGLSHVEALENAGYEVK